MAVTKTILIEIKGETEGLDSLKVKAKVTADNIEGLNDKNKDLLKSLNDVVNKFQETGDTAGQAAQKLREIDSALKAVQGRNEKLENELKLFGLEGVDRINAELKIQLATIDQRIAKEGKLDKRIVEQLEKEKELTKELASKRVAALNKVEKEAKEAAAATAQISKVKGFESFQGKVVALQAGFSLLAGAIRSASNAISQNVTAFASQEQAELNLQAALMNSGRAIEGNFQRLQAYSKQMQATTTLGDEMALSQAAVAINMGLTIEQTERLTQASADMAIATNRDVNQAFRLLLKSTGGYAGELAEIIPEIKELTKEQLRQIGAIDFVINRWGGLAERTKSTRKELLQAKNAFGDLRETMGELILGFAGIATGGIDVASTIQSIDSLLRSMEPVFVFIGGLVSKMGDMFTTSISFILMQFNLLKTGVIGAANVITKVLNKIGVVSDETAASVSKSFGDSAADLKLSAKTFGEGLKTTVTDWSAFSGKIFKERKLENTFEGARKKAQELSEEVKKLIETLQSENLALAQEISLGFAANEVQAATMELNFQVDAIKRKMAAEENLTEAVKEQYEIQIQLTEFLGNKRIQAAKDSMAAELRAMDEVNKAIEDQIKSLGASTLEQIEIEKKAQIRALEERLKFEKDLTAEQQKRIKEQITLTEQLSEKRKQDFFEPEKLFDQDQVDIIGDRLGSETANFVSAASSLMSGPLAAIEAAKQVVGALQSVVNAIPDLLNSVSGLINSITDLPNVLLEAVKNLRTAIVRFIDSFIPNIISAIPEVVATILELVTTGLTNAVISLIDRLPIVITDLLNRLPEVVEQFVAGLISQTPRIAIALISFLIKDAPRLSLAIAKTLIIEVPKAIVKGIIMAFNTILGDLQSLFGQIPDQIAGGIDQGVKDLGKQIAKSSEQLFAVRDLADAVQPVSDPMQAIQDVIGQGIDQLRQLWEWFLERLNAVWMWVKEKILDPLFEVVQQAWMWVKTNIIDPLLTVVQQAWQWVVDRVLNPLMGFVQRAFQWVIDKILTPMRDVVAGAFGWVKEKILDPLLNVVRSAFKPVLKVLKSRPKWVDTISKIFGGLEKAIKSLADLPEKLKKSITPGGGGGSFLGKIDKATGGNIGKIGSALGGNKNKKGPVTGIKGSPFASGGIVPKVQYLQVGGSVGSDTVPAMLTPGEFVMSRSAVGSIGAPRLEQMNRTGTTGGGNVSFGDIVINAQTSLDSESIRTEVVPEIIESIKRKSQDGEFVIDAKGIRRND